jgi:hypothetical protein
MASTPVSQILVKIRQLFDSNAVDYNLIWISAHGSDIGELWFGNEFITVEQILGEWRKSCHSLNRRRKRLLVVIDCCFAGMSISAVRNWPKCDIGNETDEYKGPWDNNILIQVHSQFYMIASHGSFNIHLHIRISCFID